MIRRFQEHEIEAAIRYAVSGGQALHLHTCIPDPDRAPRCFVDAVNRGEFIAHLYDQNAVRLEMTASLLGVRVILIEKRGTIHQHVDLCGGPLRKAITKSKGEFE